MLIKSKVSIIIPAYNAHKYLKEAIDSALNQTYKNIEIIVINDGSNDNTDKIAKSYGNKIKYFKKENGGVSSALNLGIKNMTGDYFSWLSHDDRYYPNKIADQIQYLNSIDLNSNVILYSDYDLMNSKSEVYDKCIKNHEELIQKPEYGLLRGSINGITLLIPKQAFEECGMFDENLRCTQDYELWVKMQNKYSFIHQPTILATTRIHNKQQGNTNPLMLKEGNPFWINFITNIPLATKEKLEGTEYNFYFEMLKFLESSPYKKTVNFINEKLLNIKNSSKEDIDNTLVSVIIPFYNRIDMVINAITSVINQTHKNIEIILINDGSTDNLEPILKFINNNDNIKLFSLENNSGPSNARNLGLEKASGQYIAFLDSDDIFIENKIEFQLQEMYLKGYLFSHTSYFKKSSNNKTLMDSGKLNGFVIPKIICECTIATPTIMINRQILTIKDFKYDTGLNIGEDVCLYLSILKDIPILGIQIPLTIVNVNENTSAYNYEKQQEGIMNIIKFIINDPDLIKYDNEFACLLKIYINIINKKNPTFNLYQHNNSKSNLFNWLKRKFNLLKRLIWLFKNDKIALKDLIIYKFKNHPTFLKILIRIIH